jgi:hypothetical protein
MAMNFGLLAYSLRGAFVLHTFNFRENSKKTKNSFLALDIFQSDRRTMILIVFLPLIEIWTKIINHTNKETVYNPLTSTYTYR